MGYYSSIEFDGRVRKDKIKEFNENFKKLEDEWENGSNPQGWVGYYIGLRADEEGYVYFEDGDYYGKFYDNEELIGFLLKNGFVGDVKLVGEDGHGWGYMITEDGRVLKLEQEWIVINEQ